MNPLLERIEEILEEYPQLARGGHSGNHCLWSGDVPRALYHDSSQGRVVKFKLLESLIRRLLYAVRQENPKGRLWIVEPERIHKVTNEEESKNHN